VPTGATAPPGGLGLRGWSVAAIAITALVMSALATWLAVAPTRVADVAGSTAAKPSVAVLPFDNLGDKPEQDYFADGVTAHLITDLSKVSGLFVIAPGSVFPYKGTDTPPRQVSAELAVDYVVSGSVQRSGQRLRVHVQLIGARDERAIWGEHYEGTPADVFAIQDMLTAAVISVLQVELPPAERELLSRRATTSVVAYDYYLRGIEAHGRRSSAQNREARRFFQQATELDPDFARAYAGLAMSHARDALDGWVSTPMQSLERAETLIDRAEAIDTTLAQVHFVRGLVNLFSRRHLDALTAARRALQVDPNYADAHALSAWILNYAGRSGEAELSMDKAMRLNPKASASYFEVLGEIRFAQRRYADAVAVFDRVLAINPNYMRARMWNAASLVQTGEIDRAEWQVTELLALDPGLSLQQLGFAFPFKDPRELDRVVDGLRTAGLPERPDG